MSTNQNHQTKRVESSVWVCIKSLSRHQSPPMAFVKNSPLKRAQIIRGLKVACAESHQKRPQPPFPSLYNAPFALLSIQSDVDPSHTSLHFSQASLSLSLSNFYLTSFPNFPFYYFPSSNPLGAMDPIQVEKHQAMKRYRGKQPLPTFIQYCLTVAVLVLLLSSLLWLPHMFSSIKKFFLVSLPNIGAIIFRPKCLFIVSNIIIIFLIGESKLSKSPPASDIYEEYVARRQSLQSLSSDEVKVVESVMEETVKEESVEEESLVKEDPSNGEDKEEDEEMEEEEEEKSGGVEQEEVMERKCEELGEEEEMGLPPEELNRRVEDFIAKFNMQRRLEARMLVCYG